MTVSILTWSGDSLFATVDANLFLSSLSGSISNSGTIGLGSGSFCVELRARFPLAGDENLAVTSLSGSLFTVTAGTTHGQFSLWYEKDSLASTTGNIYLTSSAGRCSVTGIPVFDDRFYNMSVVKDRSRQSLDLRVIRHDRGELVFSTGSAVASGAVGYPAESVYSRVIVGSDPSFPSSPQFWGQEFRVWNDALAIDELQAHSAHFESYGRSTTYFNNKLLVHWRLNEGISTDSNGVFYGFDSSVNDYVPTGSFASNTAVFTKFLEDYAYIPSIDYGWNQEKVRVFNGSRIDPLDSYHDERFVSLEFNMYDALNEDISHIMSSYDELTRMVGLPVNRYREDYEGLQQMRETYFKRLQGRLNFRVFADMLDFFDSSFSSIVERLLPARSSFHGDEMVVESHMLERPKYQYQLRPVIEGRIEISGSISVVDRGDDFD